MYDCLGQIKLPILPLQFWLPYLSHLLRWRGGGQHTKCLAAAIGLPFQHWWISPDNKELVAVFPPCLAPKWLCLPASQVFVLMPLSNGILLCCGHQSNQIHPAWPGNSQCFHRTFRDYNFSRKNLFFFAIFTWWNTSESLSNTVCLTNSSIPHSTHNYPS